MVTVQMLSELEEIIQFKLVPERREAIKRTWWNRLQVSGHNNNFIVSKLYSVCRGNKNSRRNSESQTGLESRLIMTKSSPYCMSQRQMKILIGNKRVRSTKLFL